MVKPLTATETHFENLWRNAQSALKNGTITPATMLDGSTLPKDYCLSTVARISSQSHSPLHKIEVMLNDLRNRLPHQFFYDLQALHISLLGCTPRLSSKSMFDSHRKEKIRDICFRTLQGKGSAEMYLQGLGLIGNQVFIQVFPQNNHWATLRQNLEAELLLAGEQPMSHPDKRPIHLNIMRITEVSPATLIQLEAALQELHNEQIGPVIVRSIEYLLTDFVLSETNLLAQIDLEQSTSS